jgi:hypothetical protein
MRTIMETAKKQLVGSLGKLRVWATGHPWGVLGSLVLLVVVVLIFFAALFPDVAPPWLGLGTQRLTEVTVTRQAGDYSFVSKKTIEPPKNLWDWLDLLIVTAVVAVGVFLLNQSARRGESRVADDRQRQETLRNYFDKMSDLLIEEGLKVVSGRGG